MYIYTCVYTCVSDTDLSPTSGSTLPSMALLALRRVDDWETMPLCVCVCACVYVCVCVLCLLGYRVCDQYIYIHTYIHIVVGLPVRCSERPNRKTCSRPPHLCPGLVGWRWCLCVYILYECVCMCVYKYECVYIHMCLYIYAYVGIYVVCIMYVCVILILSL
jgi:hypothetical protein